MIEKSRLVHLNQECLRIGNRNWMNIIVFPPVTINMLQLYSDLKLSDLFAGFSFTPPRYSPQNHKKIPPMY